LHHIFDFSTLASMHLPVLFANRLLVVADMVFALDWRCPAPFPNMHYSFIWVPTYFTL